MAQRLRTMGGVVAVRAFSGVRVFVTGHTGFKGAWLVATLKSLGAVVGGYALEPSTMPNLFEEARLEEDVAHVVGDVRDLAALSYAMQAFDPDLVMHLAAQPLVLAGLADPIGTFGSNVLGTAHCLEAARRCSRVRASIIVTSDKCYQPAVEPLAEGHALGGDDPYSASKACAEIVTQAYRHSYGSSSGYAIASVRAGNVIGGGDWSPFRLLPDLARAQLSKEPVILRHPDAVRPWQHVADALAGYLIVAERALRGDVSMSRAWNFGPARSGHLTVAEVVNQFCTSYGSPLNVRIEREPTAENPTLLLDSSAARSDLGWSPRLNVSDAISDTARFYRRRACGESVRALLYEGVSMFFEATKVAV